MECTSQPTGAVFTTFCMKLTSVAQIPVRNIYSQSLSIIPMAFIFFMYPYFMQAETVKIGMCLNIVCINMTDWEVQIFISDP